ncbi:hypothetical protein Kpol_1018p105 [Vanderwaltozyma polyspora DSM 70294]|uniref:HTH APSES-type domain-containing protein n=1 Tax=Vanderwaltozyma polyspora (strain ATCC 22028 / DSM 70294 / BCRC 21397 / CBS 2163 / NBRC 10782 / NRRL Y-8283 / UCD 57-17) TaxID=436907 RepID=A7TDV2_VANPO|nr:uncharacterized protein Kpol_1018p105 [Vanderwaltozyma polyspora DSM 70294]EDO19572.1 hypothetical protein Kpol_1018p105 [Vanderwaltozyma polyspora DSM 70294]
MEFGTVIMDTNKLSKDNSNRQKKMNLFIQSSTNLSFDPSASISKEVNFIHSNQANNWNQKNMIQLSSANTNINDNSSLLPQNTGLPVIEIATYAETDVYECYIRGSESRIVMRRTSNDWINITQIFKLASFTKTKRTKVLEIESNNIQHEKVQGGYGRFQGTWIPLNDAKNLVQKYNIVDPVVTTIINFVLDPNNPPVKRSKNSVLKRNSPGVRINSPSSYNKTPKKKNSTSSSTSSQSVGVKKSKKINGSNSHINPSPLQNIAFQTPQQLSSSHSNGMNTIHATDTTIETLSNGEGRNTSTNKNPPLHMINTDQTPLPNGYSATQKPLQFFSVPTNVSNTQNNNGGNNNSFLTLIPENAHQSSFNGNNSDIIDDRNHNNGNVITNRVVKKRKKTQISEFAVSPDQEIVPKGNIVNTTNIHDKTQNDFKLMKQEMMLKYSAQKYSNHLREKQSSSDSWSSTSTNVISSQENQTPVSSRSATPNAFQSNRNMAKFTMLSAEKYKDLILQTLSSEDYSNSSSLPPALYHPPPSLDINFEVDDQGHTALHWAVAMSNIPLIKLLLALNADVLKCNKRGFNSVTKLVFYNNCFKAGSFPEILSLLKVCLISADMNNRLPLHYLIELSVNNSKDPTVIHYYMDMIIKILGTEDYSLLKMCLNFQDSMGNTVLHLAALNMNIDIYNTLLQFGASADIANFNNETPSFILAKYNLYSSQISRTNITTSFDNVLDLQNDLQTMSSSKPSKESGDDSFKHQLLDHQHLGISTPLVTNDKKDVENEMNNISTIMEDISTIENMVSSTVMDSAEPLHKQLLKHSPTLYKTKPTIDSTKPVLEKPVTLLEAPSPILPIGNNELEDIPESIKIASQLAKLSEKLTEEIRVQIDEMQTEVEKTKHSIDIIDKQIIKTKSQKKVIFNQFNNGSHNINSMTNLENIIMALQNEVEEQKHTLYMKLERAQSNNLVKLIKEENKHRPDLAAAENDKLTRTEEYEGLLAELNKLKANKKRLIREIVEKTATNKTSSKILKYKKLSGIEVDDIDSKLDEIEQDLRLSI